MYTCVSACVRALTTMPGSDTPRKGACTRARAHVRAFVRSFVRACVRAREFLRACLWLCVCVRACVRMCACVRAFKCVFVPVCACGWVGASTRAYLCKTGYLEGKRSKYGDES